MIEDGELIVQTICDDDVEGVVALWQKCGLTRTHNDPYRDIAFARERPSSEVLVGRIGGSIATTAMVGHDGHRGTVYYVACDPDQQGRGLGRKTMDIAQAWLVSKGAWKLNLMIREGNEKAQGFYEALGYECEPRIVMSRMLPSQGE